MPELRKDPVLSRWVIIAKERGSRPQFYEEPPPKASDPKLCPFCPGNEHMTPPELYAIRSNGSPANGNHNWKLRVIPNKFPVLRIEGGLDRRGVGMYDQMNGIGAHEVVVETEEHFKLLHNLPVLHIFEVFKAYRERMRDLMRDGRFEYIIVFKNQGMRAGASLDHPHGQIIALPIVPKRVMEEINGSAAHWNNKKRCIYKDIIDQELWSEQRIVLDDERFLVFCPYASLVPFETWIVPKIHEPAYQRVTDEELMSLAGVMRTLLAKYVRALGQDFDYNFIIHTLPSDGWCQDNMPIAPSAYRWHIEFYPKLSKTAGFEWGTEFYINPTPPEEAAAFLRDIELDD